MYRSVYHTFLILFYLLFFFFFFFSSKRRHTRCSRDWSSDVCSSDLAVFFAPDQRRSRGRTAIVGEWRARWGSALSTDLAVRRDDFNRFEDSTNVRAAVVGRPLDRLRRSEEHTSELQSRLHLVCRLLL